MRSISLFAEKDTEKQTLALYDIINKFDLSPTPKLSINNTRDAQSGLLFRDDQLVEISLANCYNMEDVVVSLIQLLSDYAVEKHSENGNS